MLDEDNLSELNALREKLGEKCTKAALENIYQRYIPIYKYYFNKHLVASNGKTVPSFYLPEVKKYDENYNKNLNKVTLMLNIDSLIIQVKGEIETRENSIIII